MTTMGAYLRQQRERCGLTQAELARRTDVPQSTIARLEDGTSTEPSARVLHNLAERLQTTVAKILSAGRDGEADDPYPLRTTARLASDHLLATATWWHGGEKNVDEAVEQILSFLMKAAGVAEGPNVEAYEARSGGADRDDGMQPHEIICPVCEKPIEPVWGIVRITKSNGRWEWGHKLCLPSRRHGVDEVLSYGMRDVLKSPAYYTYLNCFASHPGDLDRLVHAERAITSWFRMCEAVFGEVILPTGVLDEA